MTIGSSTGEVYEDELDYKVKAQMNAGRLTIDDLILNEEAKFGDVPSKILKRPGLRPPPAEHPPTSIPEDYPSPKHWRDEAPIKTAEQARSEGALRENRRQARLLEDTLLGRGGEFPDLAFPEAQKKSEAPTGDLTARMRERFGNPPVAVRAFTETVAGDRSKITEEFFQPAEIEVLRETAEKVLAKGKRVMGYGDYGVGGQYEKSFDRFARGGESGTDQIMDAMTDMRSSLSFTLGMARVRREQDGTIVITDDYDFAAKKKQVDELKNQGVGAVLKVMLQGFAENGLLGLGNVVGNLAVPEGEGRPVEIRIPPRRRQ